MMKIIRREWTDLTKWIMGIVGSLIVAIAIALWPNSEKSCRPKYDIALLLGYEAAIGLAKSVQNKNISNERGLVNGYLTALGIDDIHYPSTPVSNEGKPANDFAHTVLGRLKSIHDKPATAFYLGWQGVIGLNTPNMRPSNFDVNVLANRAGFPSCKLKSEINCLEWLVERARKSQGPTC